MRHSTTLKPFKNEPSRTYFLAEQFGMILHSWQAHFPYLGKFRESQIKRWASLTNKAQKYSESDAHFDITNHKSCPDSRLWGMVGKCWIWFEMHCWYKGKLWTLSYFLCYLIRQMSKQSWESFKAQNRWHCSAFSNSVCGIWSEGMQIQNSLDIKHLAIWQGQRCSCKIKCM